MLHTFKPKRDQQIVKTINGWNDAQISDATRIRLTTLGEVPIIISFTKNYGDTINDEVIVQTIRDYAARKEATYERWDRNPASGGTQTSRNDRLRRDLDIDMVNPGPAQGSRRKRSTEVALDESDDSDEQSSESDQSTAMRRKRTARLVDPGNSDQQAASAVVAPVGQPSLQEIMDELKDLKRQVAELSADNHDQGAVLQDINAKTTEQLSLRQDLEVTRQERDDERFAKRSQAGKMSVVTAKLNVTIQERNELQAKNTQMEAEKQRLIEHSEVIRTIRQGFNALMPLGCPNDQSPFDDAWMRRSGYYQHYSVFKVNLEENYSKASLSFRRDDLPTAPPIPESAKIRLFMHGLGVVLDNPGNEFDLDNSPAMHRFDLALYSGPIFSQDTFNKIRTTMELHLKFFCSKLSRDYIEDDTVYPTIVGDAFKEPEVMCFFLLIFVFV